MKKRNVFWGIIFIVIAACILISGLGYFPGVNFFKLVLTIALIAILANGIAHVNFAGILFPIAFFCILYSEMLGLEDLTPWPVLWIALFGSIGLSFIFPHHKHFHGGHYNESFSTSENTEYGNEINCSVSFNSSVKYINSTNFERAHLESSFGTLKVFFDQAVFSKECAEVKVDVSFGTAILFIPKDWNVQINVNTSFGALDEKGVKVNNPDAPTLFITGDVSFGNVEINYI